MRTVTEYKIGELAHPESPGVTMLRMDNGLVIMIEEKHNGITHITFPCGGELMKDEFNGFNVTSPLIPNNGFYTSPVK